MGSYNQHNIITLSDICTFTPYGLRLAVMVPNDMAGFAPGSSAALMHPPRLGIFAQYCAPVCLRLIYLCTAAVQLEIQPSNVLYPIRFGPNYFACWWRRLAGLYNSFPPKTLCPQSRTRCRPTEIQLTCICSATFPRPCQTPRANVAALQFLPD